MEMKMKMNWNFWIVKGKPHYFHLKFMDIFSLAPAEYVSRHERERETEKEEEKKKNTKAHVTANRQELTITFRQEMKIGWVSTSRKTEANMKYGWNGNKMCHYNKSRYVKEYHTI